jgi:hypothetical protein
LHLPQDVLHRLLRGGAFRRRHRLGRRDEHDARRVHGEPRATTRHHRALVADLLQRLRDDGRTVIGEAERLADSVEVTTEL